ncbi:hypothetical protein EMPS_08847 [Entomortierella parvispora]|uniref:Uncharacterized protein n=1 Tax=Entomortierella parvispora TaxID=205924 RepID=A0A9P3HHF0_9FUNG|nr:hypothetical protein EMPS_08847 [Entomortierella parvispora]
MLRNTMPNNPLTLLCLVEGESNPIPVEIDPAKSDRKPIVLNEVDSAIELNDPTDDVSDAFKEQPPKKTISIIVQRPAPALAPSRNSGDVSRPSTPIPSIFIPQDRIEAEVADILKGVDHHHTTQSISAKDAEATQRGVLGRFYKRPLPYHEKAENIRLVMLGLEQDIKQRRVMAKLFVRSWTRMLADQRIFGCIASPTISPGFTDPNFIILAKDIESMYRAVIHKNQGGWQDAVDTDSEVKALAGERIKIEFLARQLFLLSLLNNNPDLEPRQFFLEQTKESATSTIGDLVNSVRNYDDRTVDALLRKVQSDIRARLLPRDLGVVIALDEAQVAANDILPGKLISPSALAKNRKVLFDDKGQLQSEYRRGFLTILSATLSNMRATLVILGTALSLQNADHVYSAVAKQTNDSRITDFPSFSKDEVSTMLSDLVDMEDCVIPEAKRRKLSGRARFVVDVVNHLTKHSSTGDDKQAVLDNAIDKSIEHTLEGLRRPVRSILANDKSGKDKADFVDKSLCKLRPHPDGIHMVMDEPMVIEAVEIELKASGKDPAFLEYLDQIFQIVTNFGLSTTSKGDAFEPLVRRCLQRFNGYPVVDLPFLQGVNLPAWCHNLILQTDSINTANGLGYTETGLRGDLEFLKKCPSNQMLIAQFGTRPDGLWFFSDNQYAGSLAIKLYSDNISKDLFCSNVTSSNVRGCFLGKDGISVSKANAAIWQEFLASGTPANLRGVLRIHIELPGVSGGNPVTYVKTDTVNNTEDVMVHINLSNLESFFYEGIPEHRDDVRSLVNMIRVTSSP